MKDAFENLLAVVILIMCTPLGWIGMMVLGVIILALKA